jgi:energy-coupling factor transporter ATP-binding protein EcfA2
MFGMDEIVVRTDRLTQGYGERLAVDSVSLTVGRGEAYGFLGPNGAGKTTTLRMPLELVRPTGGRASVLGAKPGSPAAFARVGALVEGPASTPTCPDGTTCGCCAAFTAWVTARPTPPWTGSHSTDAAATGSAPVREYDRFASLFTQDGMWRIPHAHVEFVGPEEIRAGIEWLRDLWDYAVQTRHPGTIRLQGDTAVGRAYVAELGRMRDDSSQLNYAVHHDLHQRTPDGSTFATRVYEVIHLDTTPLSGSAPHRVGALASRMPRPSGRPAEDGRSRERGSPGTDADRTPPMTESVALRRPDDIVVLRGPTAEATSTRREEDRDLDRELTAADLEHPACSGRTPVADRCAVVPVPGIGHSVLVCRGAWTGGATWVVAGAG